MRYLAELRKQDGTLTVSELIAKYEREEAERNQKDADEFEFVKTEFKDVYLKRINKCSLFGRTLEVYHIEEITHQERTMDWTFIYRMKGPKVSFSKRDINIQRSTDISFDLEDLQAMEKITKEEFEKYVDTFGRISGELNELIK